MKEKGGSQDISAGKTCYNMRHFKF